MPGYLVPEHHHLTPGSEIEARIAKAQEALSEQGLDALFISHGVDLFYLSGTRQSGFLLVPARKAPLLLIRREFERAKSETPLKEVVPLESFRDLPGLTQGYLGDTPRKLGVELDVLPVNLFSRYQSLWPDTQFVDASPLILKLRSVKSAYEIGKMRKSGELAASLYAQIPGFLEPRMTEMELAGKITAAAYRAGHQNYLHARGYNQEIFSWHVIGGQSGGIVSAVDAPFGGFGISPAFPYGASQKKILPGEGVLVDFGICRDGYPVDLTRMFALGSAPDLICRAYDALAEIEKTLIKNLAPGTIAEDLYRLAVDKAETLGFGEAFLGLPGLKARFAGHGVGLEVSEPPFLAPGHKTALESGMTLALELKMVFAGIGAAGLENTVSLQETGIEKLTPADERFIIV